ncbi:MAG: hypothetical protein ABW143_02155 [Acidimicrobiales bacterium]
MRRITAILVTLLMMAGCSGDDGGERDPAPSDTTTPAEEAPGPTLGPLVSGTASVVDGTFVWTDYAYDDRGPDTEPGTRTDIDAAGGDATYGTGWRNEADIVQTQVGLDADGRVTVRVVLETLTDPSMPVVMVAFDTDADRGTGAIALGAAWAPGSDAAQGLGVDRLAVLRQDGGEFLTYDGGTFGPAEPLDVTVDADANTITAVLPLEPDGETWSAFAAAGTSEGEGSWFDGGVTLHDLGFVGSEPEYRWQDDIQADLLAGDGDVADALTEVDLGVLAEGGTELADATTPGFHTYLYESALELGEGVVPAEEDGLEYNGPYQPYLVWIPEDGPGEGEPMSVFLHGLTQNHVGSVLSPDGSYLGTGRTLSEERHLLEQYARDGLDFTPHSLTVWPLARGEGLGYRGIAEQDVLDVLADASDRFAPDPDRIILSGGSMGGIGAFRLGALYPDLFSVNAPLIGLATEDTASLRGNLWNLPVRQINGLLDPLIPADAAAGTTDQLDRLELDYQAWMLDQRGHEAGGFVYDCVFASLPEFERVAAPAEVRYTVDPAQFVSDPETGLELSYDGAYWVSGMVVADESDLGSVVARSSALDGSAFDAVHVDRRGGSGPDGGDLCGDNPAVTTDDTWRERAVERMPPAGLVTVGPVLHLQLTNLSAITVDVATAGLTDEGEIDVNANGAVEVTLTGLEPETVVTVGDEELVADADGTVTFTAPADETTATF